MQNIIDGIRRYYPVSDNSLNILFSKMKKLELPKKHLLIKEGVIDRHVYEPGYEYVELLENCTLYAIAINDLNNLYETNIEIANWGRVIHQECLLYMDQHHNDQLFLSAKERYAQLLKELPDVIHRANQNYISSYLEITPQHLSRLRAVK